MALSETRPVERSSNLPAVNQDRPGRNAWERWAPAWRIVAVMFMVATTWAAWSDPRLSAPGKQRYLLLILLFAAWYFLQIPLGWKRLRGHRLLTIAWFLAGYAIWIVLLQIHSAAYGLAGVLYPITYVFLPISWAIGGAGVLTLIMGLAGNGWSFRFSTQHFMTGLLSFGAGAILALYINAIIEQSRERQRLLEKLEAARDELARAERQAGVFAERQRLAQQIHDHVAQAFVGIVTHLEAAEASLGAPPAGVRPELPIVPAAPALTAGSSPLAAHLAAAKESARASLAEARALVWDLRPDLRGGEPLDGVLARQLAEWSAASGVLGKSVVTGNPVPLGPAREAALVQAVREALNNVRTHARATTVTVTLSYMEDAVALDVRDDGTGIESTAKSPEGGGFGLRALDERIRALGGRAAVESGAGEGTTLTVTLPISAVAS